MSKAQLTTIFMALAFILKALDSQEFGTQERTDEEEE